MREIDFARICTRAIFDVVFTSLENIFDIDERPDVCKRLSA